MGLITQTITFVTGLIPTANQWQAQFDSVYNLVNGQIDSANVDKTSADGIMVLDTAQTRTGTLTHNADIIIGNTYGLLIGNASQVAGGGVTPELEVLGTAGADSSGLFGRWSADALGPILYLGKSRNATIGSFTIVQDNDILGEINFLGDDGTDMATPGASIFARVNGTPGANDMPTELVFAITKDAGSAVTEAFQITTAGFIFNEGGEDWDFRAESDTNANAFNLDAGLFGGVGAIGLGALALNTASVLVDPPAFTAVANTNIARLRLGNTAAVTVPAGTTSIAATLSIEEPNLTATGTVTNAVTFYISGAPTEGTNNYSAWFDSGNIRADGVILAELGSASAAAYSFQSSGTEDGDTGMFSSGANTVNFATAGTERLRFGSGGAVLINGTSDAGLTIGIVADQGANDDFSGVFRSSDVVHGLTSGAGITVSTSTYFAILKQGAGSFALGGTNLYSFGENDALQTVNLALNSHGGVAEATAVGTGSVSLVQIYATQHNGANAFADIAADGHVFGIRARVLGAARTILVCDEDGDLSVDGSGTLTVFDDYPDYELARALRIGLSPSLFPHAQEVARKYADFLEQADIVSWNRDTDCVPFINLKKLSIFNLDMGYQTGKVVFEQIIPALQRLEAQTGMKLLEA